MTQQAQLSDARSWLTAALRGEQPPWPGADPAFEGRLWQTGALEGVLPLLYRQVGADPSWPLPPTLKEALAHHVRQQAMFDLLREEALQKVLAKLAQQGIEVLLMKGGALAYSHYAASYLRPRCDTDLLFADRERAEAAWQLLSGLGYRRAVGVTGELASTQLSCALPISGGSVALDIHWQLNNQQRFARAFRFDELAAEAKPVAALGPAAKGLSPAHALVLATLHRVGHLHDGSGDRLLWLWDIHLLADRMSEAEWDAVISSAESRGLATVILDGLRRAESEFATSLSAAIVQRLEAAAAIEDFSLDRYQGHWRRELDNWRALGSWEERRRFLQEHLLPAPDYLLARYGVRSKLWLPWLYLHRAMRGVWRRLPK